MKFLIVEPSPLPIHMVWLISQLMNEKKDSVDKLLHLINNDMSLIFGVPSAPAHDGMSAVGYEFLKLFFPVDSEMKMRTNL